VKLTGLEEVDSGIPKIDKHLESV
jgi:calcium-dependent protein kinase